MTDFEGGSTEHSAGEQASTPSPEPSGSGPNDTAKLLAALGYPLFIPAIIALFMDPYKDEEFSRYHAFNAIGLALAAMVISFILGVIPIIGWIVGLLFGPAVFIYAIVLAIKAYGGAYPEIPFVTGFIKQYV